MIGALTRGVRQYCHRMMRSSAHSRRRAVALCSCNCGQEMNHLARVPPELYHEFA